jgi:ribosome-associated protein
LGLEPEILTALVARSAQDKKAHDIIILDLKELSAITDYFVICSGESELHVRAIAGQIIEDLEKEGEGAWHVEGHSSANWILIDYVDVVVHIFHHKMREYYALERLWGDAPMQKVESGE